MKCRATPPQLRRGACVYGRLFRQKPEFIHYPQFSKHVFHSKLKNPWTANGGSPAGLTRLNAAGTHVAFTGVTGGAAKDSAKSIRVSQNRSRITRPEAVRHVECFGADLDSLVLTDLELPGHGLAPIPISRPDDAVLTDIPITAESGYSKGCSVEVIGNRTTVAIGIRTNLVRTLQGVVVVKEP